LYAKIALQVSTQWGYNKPFTPALVEQWADAIFGLTLLVADFGLTGERIDVVVRWRCLLHCDSSFQRTEPQLIVPQCSILAPTIPSVVRSPPSRRGLETYYPARLRDGQP
jgi:hypothetical protein